MSRIQRDYSEKRDFIRMEVETTIELSYPEGEGNRFEGLCTDLSASGMSVVVDAAVPEGTELQTYLPSGKSDFPPFETLATVLRCAQLEDGRYQLGLEIAEVRR